MPSSLFGIPKGYEAHCVLRIPFQVANSGISRNTPGFQSQLRGLLRWGAFFGTVQKACFAQGYAYLVTEGFAYKQAASPRRYLDSKPTFSMVTFFKKSFDRPALILYTEKNVINP
jgi:hypothetical protein